MTLWPRLSSCDVVLSLARQAQSNGVPRAVVVAIDSCLSARGGAGEQTESKNGSFVFSKNLKNCTQQAVPTWLVLLERVYPLSGQCSFFVFLFIVFLFYFTKTDAMLILLGDDTKADLVLLNNVDATGMVRKV